jgi:SAM-dependent methyltransferase
MLNKTNLYKLLPDWLKLAIFNAGGKKPFSKGYTTFKFKYIKESTENQQIMEKFGNSEKLPESYGYGLDERAVEYPWVLSRIPSDDSVNFLDAGSALNYKDILEHKNLKNKKITIVNLNPEENCFWHKEISYLFSDIRNLPFKDNCFDLITCVSSLEHVGMDNAIYSDNQKYREKEVFDFEKAVLELKRVLRPGGKVLITVPFGKYENFGWFQQFDAKLVNRISDVFEPQKKKVDYYKYTKSGWDVSSEESCKNVQYSKVINEDSAAAAGSVACLELTK